MATRVIPRRTKVQIEFLRNFTLTDLIYCIIVGGVAIGLFVANFDYNIYIALAWLSIGIAFFVPVEDGLRIYTFLWLVFRFFAFRKKFSKEKKRGFADMKDLIPFERIYADKYIDYGEYKASVIQVKPLSFYLYNEFKQNMLINTFANAIRRLNPDQEASIVKITKPIIFDDYITNEELKLDVLERMCDRGEISQEELRARSDVLESRVIQMSYNNTQEKKYKDFFYIVVYDKDMEALDTTIQGMKHTLESSVTPITCNFVTGADLAIFLKGTYTKEFNEREVRRMLYEDYADWVQPDEVKFRMGTTVIDGQPYKNFTISDFPLYVGNAWGNNLFAIDKSRVVVNVRPCPKLQSEKQIDKAIMEMENKYYRTGKSSTQIELQTHLETLKGLLQSLKNNNEQLYNVNMHITCEEAVKKEVRAMIKQNGFKYSEMFGRQVDAFISSSISKRDTIKEFWRGIPTTTLAAMFPFVSSELQDERGFYIGYNEYPVFINLFLRNSERVNSNMMIIGKSGSGKSYATKTLLANLAADNTKIFILDPENEYDILTEKAQGKMMDVGSSNSGTFNPFHIMTTLEADEGKTDDSYSLHLQFLEEFFRIILDGLNPDAFELLNSIVTEVYARKGIGKETIIKELKPEDFPIFDDLLALIREKIPAESDPYKKQNFQTIETYIEKFGTGGRNSNLWNGPQCIETKENFITFSFLSLLSNRNQLIAAAQMLLVFKYLDNEIIKNRDFNAKYFSPKDDKRRRIIVVVDEAHVFINPKYPIALDFMAQMAKRIRKYDGMQIVITQNIKDFVGSQEIQRQSTAIINASQYSFIFSLAPNDMTDLVDLYRNAGEINEEEQNSIVTAGVGNCFMITGPLSRTMVQIDAQSYLRKLFQKE
ncbi:MAG: ATP-binding protein [Clostridia bacterium]|nr:ATP-binding protein [Clostridia bacterium]